MPANTSGPLGGGGVNLEKSERKSRETIGSPNTLERRNKRYSYATSRQTSIEVPYARLLDSPSRKILRQDSIEQCSGAGGGGGGVSIVRRSSDSTKSQNNNTLQIQSPKTSVSDSRLVGEVEVEDDLEVGEMPKNSCDLLWSLFSLLCIVVLW